MKLQNVLHVAALVSSCLCLTACSLYVIKKSSPGSDHHGIPFYVKTSGCKREITHLQPYYLLTLARKEDDKTVASDTTMVCRKDFASPLLDALRNATVADVRQKWTAVKQNLNCEPYAENAGDSLLISDAVSSYLYVDYSTPYTLNVRRPVIGSASATTKLAEDGTLSEGTAQLEDKTLSTVLGLVPTADLIKSAAGIKAIEAEAPYELKIEEKAVLLTRTYRDPAEHGPCDLDKNLKGIPPSLSSDLLIKDASEEKAVAGDTAIKVTGTIQLPKPKDTAKPTEIKK